MFDFLLLVSAVIFIVIDSVYLNVMKDYFNNQIKRVQGTPIKMNFLGASICRVLSIFGINYFIIKPRKSVSDAFFLGIMIYGFYETNNLALLKNWSILTVIIDTLWGGILFAATTYIVNLLR